MKYLIPFFVYLTVSDTVELTILIANVQCIAQVTLTKMMNHIRQIASFLQCKSGLFSPNRRVHLLVAGLDDPIDEGGGLGVDAGVALGSAAVSPADNTAVLAAAGHGAAGVALAGVEAGLAGTDHDVGDDLVGVVVGLVLAVWE